MAGEAHSTEVGHGSFTTEPRGRRSCDFRYATEADANWLRWLGPEALQMASVGHLEVNGFAGVSRKMRLLFYPDPNFGHPAPSASKSSGLKRGRRQTHGCSVSLWGRHRLLQQPARSSGNGPGCPEWPCRADLKIESRQNGETRSRGALTLAASPALKLERAEKRQVENGGIDCWLAATKVWENRRVVVRTRLSLELTLDFKPNSKTSIKLKALRARHFGTI